MKENPFTALYDLQKKLFISLESKKSIYLDMNVWIEFSKLDTIQPIRPFTNELFELLINLVSENKVFIPISDIHLHELFKIYSQEQYTKVLSIMNSLCKQVCFISFEQRWQNEILLIFRHLFKIKNCDQLFYDVLYTHPFFIMGDRIPDCEGLKSTNSEEKIIEFQKSFVQFAWNQHIFDIFSRIDEQGRMLLNPQEFEKTIQAYLTDQRQVNRDDYTDFNDLLLKELFGSLDFSNDFIAHLLDGYFEDYVLCNNVFADNIYKFETKDKIQQVKYAIAKYILDNNEFNILPAFGIGSYLHSVKRWEIESTYKRTDAFDIMHAQVGVPYCNYFITEHNLHGLLDSKKNKNGTCL